ncbi:MAG: NAD-dependent epimerase/dehydratase family protein [Actinomycetota bacterium]
MRAYVTGATGFIGSRVARALLRDGWDVTVLARSAERAQALADAGARVHLGDITDPASIRGSIAGHDALFHLAAWYAIGVRDRARIEQINVGGTVNVLDAAAEAQIPKIVYCSTVAALGTAPDGGIGEETHHHDGPPGSNYEETKLRAHRVAAERAAAGAPIVTVMPGAVYGHGDESMVGVLLKLYAKGLLVACPFQETGLSWSHVEDVAAGMVLAYEKGETGEGYILAGDNETIGNMFKRIQPFTHKRPPMRMPNGLVKAGIPFGPLVARVLGQEPDLLKEGLKSLSGSWMYSSKKAEAALGYRYRPIEEGIPPVIEALRAKS